MKDKFLEHGTSMRESSKSPLSLIALSGLSYSLFFASLEVMRAYRSSFWSGNDFMQWLGLLVGVMVSWVVVALLALFFRWGAAKLPGKLGDTRATCTAVMLAALIYAETVLLLSGSASLTDHMLTSFVVLVVGFASIVLREARLFFDASVFLAFAVGAFASIAASTAVAYRFLPYITFRAKAVAYAGVAAFVLASCIAFLILRAGRTKSAATLTKRSLALTACFAVLAGLISYAPRAAQLSASTEHASPSIIFIICDTLRGDYLSAYGGKVPTPAMQALADEGTLFLNSYSLAPWTLPSVYGLFSSTYPPGLPQGGSIEDWQALLTQYTFTTEDPTLAELLREKGYTTGAFVANYLLGAPDGVLRGFDSTETWPHYAPVPAGWLNLAPRLREAARRIVDCDSVPPPPDTTTLVTRHAKAFLRDHHHTPFFLWLHYMDPHDPYDPPDRYVEMEGPWPLFSPSAPYWGTPQFENNTIDIKPEHRDYIRHLYEGEIRHLDSAVGDLLAYVDALGLKDSTYVCITADHGEEFWDHGGYSHGQSLYNELTRVPLILRGPEIQHQVVTPPVSAIDLMPTFADLGEVETPGSWRGQTLRRVLEGKEAVAPRLVYLHSTNRFAWPLSWQGVRDTNLKLMRSRSGHVELYDVAKDPDESTDIADTLPKEVERLEEILSHWQASFPHTLGESTLKPPTEQEQKDLKTRLENLGYL